MSVGVIVAASSWAPVSAATITAAYDQGHPDVVINGYGTRAMGTFELTDGADRHRALCIEADVSHTRAPDAYQPVERHVDSPELDALLWWLERQSTIDDDTGVAAAALAWFYAGAVRRGGLPVWADASQDFAPITPTSPEPWDTLATFGLSHPVGLTSGGVHLDAAERRVAELHRLAVGLAPRWTLTTTGPGEFRLGNAAGPLAGIAVEITVERPGAEPIRSTATTDDAGRVTADVSNTPDGATVHASVDAPGTHLEWDGASTQRMATSTSVALTATSAVPPLPRHVDVQKTSDDPTIDVAGAVFELIDANGAVAARAQTDEGGTARFTSIDPASHPEPYSIVERIAPAGLLASPDPIPVGSASTDPTDPTVVVVPNAAATVDVSVRKRLTLDSVGPDDRSGFEFDITRRADGRIVRATTGPDGTSPPVQLTFGTWAVCEVGVPGWAAGLVDGGCIELAVDLGALAGPAIGIDYVNEVPTPTIDTFARDAVDGDQTVEASDGHAVIIDRVELAGLVPGTTYTLVGEVVARSDPDAAVTLPRPVGREFEADAAERVVELRFDVGGLPADPYVIVERLLVADQIVARHDDLTDADQTVTLVAPPPPTTTTTSTTVLSTTSTSTTAVPTTTTSSTTPTATVPPETLPPTGSSEVAARLLDWADAGFVVGVGLVALGATRPRRRDADGAGC